MGAPNQLNQQNSTGMNGNSPYPNIKLFGMGGKSVNPQQQQLSALSQLGLTRDSTGYYVDANGNYYSNPTYAPAQQKTTQSGLASLVSKTNAKNKNGALSAFGYTFNPFTGDAKGISAGQRSMVDNLVNNNLYASTPTVADLFPQLAQSQYLQGEQTAPVSSGAGRFLGTTK